MKVRALVKSYYFGRDIAPGEEYEMDDREHVEAKVLALLGKIKILDEPPKTPEQEAPQTAAAAEPPPMTTEDSALVNPQRPRYRRRDMRSEP